MLINDRLIQQHLRAGLVVLGFASAERGRRINAAVGMARTDPVPCYAFHRGLSPDPQDTQTTERHLVRGLASSTSCPKVMNVTQRWCRCIERSWSSDLLITPIA